MSTFNAALRGTSWAVAAQGLIAVGQIAYSALTARLFSPHAFGEFTAALSLQALIVLFAVTGLSSFVLKEPQLHRSQIRAINLVVFSLGLLSAVVFWFVSPLWLAWLNSPGGVEFVPLLAFATFAAPVAAVQSALLRREGNGRTDAAIYVLAFVVATGIAAVSAILLRESWTLALGTAVNPVVVMVVSRLLRTATYPVGSGRLSFDWIIFVLRVNAQSLVFFALGQVPTWSLGASTGPATLGQFSRGGTLAHLPAHALSTAFFRGTAPHWRKMQDRESSIRGVTEALILSASLSFNFFATLAALSSPLTLLWLGRGWDLAAEFAAWLALGFAMQVPLSVLANYLEIAGELSRVRMIQFANAVGLAPGVALLVWLHDFRLLMAGFVLSHLLGLVMAVFQVSAALGTDARHLLRQLIAPLISGIGCWGVAYGAAALAGFGIRGDTNFAIAAQLCSGGLAVIAFGFFTRKWQPAFRILVARDVLKRFNF